MPRKSAAARLKAKSLEVKEAGKKLTLKSSDGKLFEVEENVLLQSETIKHMIEDGCVGDVIPLPNVTGDILGKVIEFCKMHVGKKKGHTLEWDAEFIKVDIETLCHLISAANFLEIESLLDLTCRTVAEKMKEKTPEGIRRMFNIKNDLSPKEEEQIRKETPWAFE